ncbi:transcriptional regulator swi6 [Apophysomyces ossiformis]|uniref:Transcriptional regulator swi6 n=1 Tax=Apophysomyces ossiformis TaxID=679940 RepID=A0A8H7EPA1_9FUNG|nr:transcriptional regulator swi6 [Apophysomyces ossiformis]
MRRRADSYLNATQILKLAGMDKGKRTKILEREVLTGEHEKVQGGYGKYQGTWIPCDKGKELAERYQVLDLILPLIEFDISNLGDITDEEMLPTKEQAIFAHHLQEKQQHQHERIDSPSTQTSPPTSPMYAPSPAASPPTHRSSSQQNHRRPNDRSPVSRKKAKTTSSKFSEPQDLQCHSDNYRNVLMAIFFSDDGEQIPDLLRDPGDPNAINIDVFIDDQRHTALHWAAALARVKTVEVLVSNGANICRANYVGETPLMRGVMSMNVIHQRDVNGDTAFSIAKKMGCKQMMDLLDQSGTRNNYQAQPREQGSLDGANCFILNARCNQTSVSRHSDHQLVSMPPLTKRSYGPSEKGREIVSTIQRIVDALEAEYDDKLVARDMELQQLQKELRILTRRLEEANKRLEEQQSEKQQLVEAHQRIRELELALHNSLGNISNDAQPSNLQHTNAKEDIDALLNINEPVAEGNRRAISETSSLREQQLEQQVQLLQAKIQAYTRSNAGPGQETEHLRTELAEKEIQCKRVIAACCNLPIDEVDAFIEPLARVIESDPPDLEFAKVIEFMERLRHQEATDSSSTSQITSATTDNTDSGSVHKNKPSTPASAV